MPPLLSSASWNNLCASSASVPRVAILLSSHSSSIPNKTIIDDNDLPLVSNNPSILRIAILLIIDKSKGGRHTVFMFCLHIVLQNVLKFSCFPANFCRAEHMNG
jgi:hypothetical protein